MNQSLMLDVKTIRIDGGTQSRVELNQETVAEYAQAFTAGATFPPVVAFFDGANYWLADGFHRYFGAQDAGESAIAVQVINGTQRDAVLYSLKANATHGLKRTNADKRKAVETLLKDAEWAAWSDRKIAEVCGVSHELARQVRAAICQPLTDAERQVRAAICQPLTDAARQVRAAICQPLTDAQHRTVERNGKTYTQNTANIGVQQHRAAKKSKSDGGCNPITPILTVGSFNGCTEAVDQAAKQASDRTKNIPAPDASTEPESPSDYSELDAAKDQINELQIEVTRLNDSLAIECYDVSEEAKTEASRIIEELRGEVRSLEAQLAAVTISRDTYMQENAQMKAQMKMQRREIEKLKSKD